jgi:hypothetical protein
MEPDIAKHVAEPIWAHRPKEIEDRSTEEVFREQAQIWKDESRHCSSVKKAVAHRSYLRIIGLGRPAIPLLIRELEERPDHWFVALESITGEDPVPETATFDQAVKAWIEWWNHPR